MACGGDNMNDETPVGADSTAANRNAADGAAGTTGADRAGNRDLGADAPMARIGTRNPREFVEHMAATGVAEVKLGELAAQRASNAEVKKFAQRMVADHTKASTELKPIAAQLNVTMPTQPDQKHQELYDRLSKLKGAEFDREYMKAMVDGHEDVENELEQHAGDNSRPAGDRTVGTSGDAAQGQAAVNGWASKTLPSVRQHLEQAKQINDRLENQGNQSGQNR
jgi:putative membrane protein